jgi:hypothetical protein
MTEVSKDLIVQEILRKHSKKTMDIIEGKLDQIHEAVFKLVNGYQLIIDLGHNNDCIFCGLKDKYAKKAIDDFNNAKQKKDSICIKCAGHGVIGGSQVCFRCNGSGIDPIQKDNVS